MESVGVNLVHVKVLEFCAIRYAVKCKGKGK